MKKLTDADPETQSADLVAENIERLKALFPELVTEGPDGAAVNVDVLKTLVGDKTVTDADEKYGLTWHGKRHARQLALTSSTGTLRPCPEDSVNWGHTQNLMIEGDNLEVLKLLQKSYAGKVKLIYIDPPYNTGKDFVYPDDFKDNIRNYLELTGQVESGRKNSSNTEASGRFHTDWLNMLYARLKVVSSLLRQDGFIAISIDDVELPNLALVLREVFGEENGVATLVWDRNRKNDAKLFSVGHEYMVVVAKDKAFLREKKVVLREAKVGIQEADAFYKRLQEKYGSDLDELQTEWREFFRAMDEDDPRKPLGRFSKVGERGPYRDDGDISWPGGGGPKYEVLHPVTHKPCKVPAGGWVYPTLDRFNEAVSQGRVVFGIDESTLPRQIRFLFEGSGQVMISVNFSYAQTATVDFVELMGARVFENPKYWRDIERMVAYLTAPSDTVLDFFAGSGTTGHAVMAQNATDGGNRRYILVQLPEPLDSENKDQKVAADFCDKLGKPRTIAELTKERLRRAAKKIKDENPRFTGDLGFRVFKLDSSNIRAWEPDRANLDRTLLEHQEHLKADRTESDILYELLLKLGVDLCVPIEAKTITGKAVHSIGGGVLLACLSTQINRDEVEALAQGIIAWHQALAPAGDTTCVFRDSAFADDVAKTNLAAILNQYGLTNVRSL